MREHDLGQGLGQKGQQQLLDWRLVLQGLVPGYKVTGLKQGFVVLEVRHEAGLLLIVGLFSNLVVLLLACFFVTVLCCLSSDLICLAGALPNIPIAPLENLLQDSPQVLLILILTGNFSQKRSQYPIPVYILSH